MRSTVKTRARALGSLAGISLTLGLLAGCSQTANTNTMGLQPTLAVAETQDMAAGADGEMLASLPEETTVVPSPPAYAATETSGQQFAALDPATANGDLQQSVTTDYAPIIRGRAQAVAFSSRDQECLARAMFFESNRSSREGMVAVGSVVMNRVESGRWGDTVCEVVGARQQFAPGVLTRSMDAAGSDLALEASRAVLKGERHPRIYDDVLFFHTAGYKFPYDNMHYVAVAGGNSFYEKRRRMRGRPNTSQSAVMAMASTPARAASAIADPIAKVLKKPVKAVKSILPLSVEEEAAAPIPVAAPVRRPAASVEPDAARFGDIVEPAPTGKSGRLIRKLKAKPVAPQL